ncbi:MAG: CHAT domain-containing protein [Verrucomicrobia bacterium]|nr:CHAT domain-containing protein [Verrucomicrobiota bacterium]
MSKTVRDFSVHLDETEAALSVHADGRPLVGEATQRVPAEEIQSLAGLGRLLGEDANPSREEGVEAGARLFRALFAGAVRERFDEARRRVRDTAGVLRVVLKYDPPGAGQRGWLHEVPWELMFDPDCNRFLALDEDLLVVRHLRGGGDGWEPVRPRLRILLTGACPRGQEPIDCARELEEVRAVLGRPPFAEVSRVQELQHLGAARLVQELNRAHVADRPFHVWHHCGHGGHGSDGSFVLALHAQDGERDSAVALTEAARLAEILARHPELRLAVLNVCLGAGRRGLATLAAALKVPAVVGFRSRVQDQTALGFAEALWRRLPAMPVDQAVQGARRALAGTAHALDFARLVVFLRALGRPTLVAWAADPTAGAE